MVSGKLPLTHDIQLMAKLYGKLTGLIRKEKPDILHAHSPILNVLPAIWAGRKFDLPVVYEIRAFWEDAAVDHGTYKSSSLKYRAVSMLEIYACKRVAAIVTICDGIKSDLIQRGVNPAKIGQVPNAVNPGFFKPQSSALESARKWGLEGKQVIGFIGSFYKYEGLDLLVEAMHVLRDKYPNLVALLVGGGIMDDDLHNQVNNLKLEDRVVFTGRISHDQVPGVYALVDILVYPRRSMRLTDLVTPLKPLEAMAMEKACIASDVGGHRELIDHNVTGVLFSAGDSDQLAGEISRLLDNEEQRQEIGKRGRQWVESERSWTKTTEGYVNVYEHVLESSKVGIHDKVR